MIGKISLGINALLIIAVAFLFMQGPAAEENGEEVVQAASTGENVSSPENIAYIVEDSLVTWYEYVQVESKLVEDRLIAMQVELAGKSREYERETAAWQMYLQENPTAEEEALNDMRPRQQAIEKLQRQIEKVQVEWQENIMTRVGNYVDKYAAENNIDFVFNTNSMMPLFWHSSDAGDITREIADGLNVEYNASLTDDNR